ncbi:DUF742 domain-containing protein [Streptomyces sp. FXJ1.4098]|uniref:DUF742 domain-containing protein n=1 Tax=Streptomyces sp. NPDC020845 TaxID=3365096 RepID=UPI002995C4F2|nr:DUF742 domain-containing protein [Streptomyces sp. FXJ1.4098]
MATPPSGYPYGHGQQAEPHGDAPLKRFNFPSTPSRQVRSAQQPPAAPQEPVQQPHEAPTPPLHTQPLQQPYAPSYAPQGGPAGLSGLSSEPTSHQPPPSRPAPPPVRHTPEPSSPASGHNPLVRPYAMTGGRTRPRYQLAIEALVSTTADPAQLQGQLPEHQRICHLCREIKSVAEISALLTIPLGVSRILVADLAEAGLVAIHQPGGDESAGGQPDVTLLERVLSGLRKL